MSSPFDELRLPPPSPEQKRRARWDAAKAPILVVGVIVALVVVIGVGIALLTGGMTEFASAEGKFKVKLPGSLKVHTKTQDVDGATLKAFIAEETSGAYLVSFLDLPMADEVSPERINKVLDGTRDGGASSSGGKVTGDTKIQLANKYPGRDVTYRVATGVTRARYYIVGKRLYTVLVNGTGDWANSRDATSFLDSFQVTP